MPACVVSTRIVKTLGSEAFSHLVTGTAVTINPHARFRLHEAQRGLYASEILARIMHEESPALAGIQSNGKYTAFFRRKVGYLRIIFTVDRNVIEVITFYQTAALPRAP